MNLDTVEGRLLVKQVMDSTAYYARQIWNVVMNPALVDHLPRNPGWLCDYCPLYDKCVSGHVYENKKLTDTEAGGQTDSVGHQAASVDDLIGSMGRVI